MRPATSVWQVLKCSRMFQIPTTTHTARMKWENRVFCAYLFTLLIDTRFLNVHMSELQNSQRQMQVLQFISTHEHYTSVLQTATNQP